VSKRVVKKLLPPRVKNKLRNIKPKLRLRGETYSQLSVDIKQEGEGEASRALNPAGRTTLQGNIEGFKP